MAADAAQLSRGIRAGDRRALARGITLVESQRPEDRELARTLLQELLPHTGEARRIGISGVPGVGKSTLIETLGMHLIDQGERVAVLTVDPSSAVSGGSLLGDKTRMSHLSQSDRAFVRPSPTGGTLGGVAQRSREALLLCEAAGYGVVLVETVGVGQSETAVRDLVDLFVLLTLAGAGDELQGIKRGIMEVADLIAVHKADGERENLARQAAQDLREALGILRGHAGQEVPVLLCSSLENRGITELWQAIAAAHQQLRDDGGLERLRRAQAERWFEAAVEQQLMEQLLADRDRAAQHDQLRAEVAAGRIDPMTAAARLTQRGS